jgi:hypothetical protein
MAILIGGIIAVLLGIVTAVVWWPSILIVLAATVIVLLIFGGAIAVYFGIDELRYAKLTSPASTELETEQPLSAPEPKPAEQPQPSAGPTIEARYWLIPLSPANIEIVREKGLLALPSEREADLESITVGDKVVLYALAPASRFAGLVEVTGGSVRSSDTPFVPNKEGEVWTLQREVNVLRIPAADDWPESKTLLEELDFLSEPREQGKDLTRSFAAKLREIPQLTEEDYKRISRALGV